MVEVFTSKPLPREIEVVYKNGLKEEICSKVVKVAYDWRPPMCLDYCVFGHSNLKYEKRNVEEATATMNKKANGENGKTSNIPPDKPELNKDEKLKRPVDNKENSPNKKAWSVYGEILSAMKRSVNKYSVLELYDEQELRGIDDEENDVLNDDSSMAENLNKNQVMGMDRGVLETHIKAKRIQKIGDLIYGRWDWCSNMQYCDKGCRIMIGWNDDNVTINMIHSAKQSILCEIRAVLGNKRCFCSIVYAANGGVERRFLWKDLMIYKRIVGNDAWFLLGDMNVTFFPNEHSAGCSHMTSDLSDFRDCVNNIEVEDIASCGLFYTWTKNFFKVKAGDISGVLKKLDGIMGNEDFIDTFPQAHAIFLPYLISDHSPNVLHWNDDHDGCQMFRMVKKLKSLKKDIKNLTWKDGNIFDKVNTEYVEAIKDEEKLLFQKAKIKWLSLGDINNNYFHKVLKSRNNKNVISQINDEKWNSYFGEEVAEQFVKHFQEFLGKAV
ncbi:RNA-directed DNA polymerase, eukaryota, reverse transcriptase zinc-binding domain protein [Tanacetum coccineum]